MGGCDISKHNVLFQFPSNGKAYPKCSTIFSMEENMKKFQFPSNGKAYPKISKMENIAILFQMFQFPSNGKAYPKCKGHRTKDGRAYCVSIPFKRESISKEDRCYCDSCTPYGCVSIPFKRESISKACLKRKRTRTI